MMSQTKDTCNDSCFLYFIFLPNVRFPENDFTKKRKAHCGDKLRRYRLNVFLERNKTWTWRFVCSNMHLQNYKPLNNGLFMRNVVVQPRPTQAVWRSAWLQIIFCSCVNETTLFSFLRSLLGEKWRIASLPEDIYSLETNLVIEW